MATHRRPSNAGRRPSAKPFVGSLGLLFAGAAPSLAGGDFVVLIAWGAGGKILIRSLDGGFETTSGSQ